MAHDLFMDIGEKEFSDFLGAALAQAKLGEWKRTEKILDDATRLSQSDNPTDLKILHGLLEQVRQNTGLTLFKDSYVERIGEMAVSKGSSASRGLPRVSDFCSGV
jgi:hypothetical protein